MDLKPIGCDKTQGEDACEIAVNKNGTKVYLHVMSDKKNMYEYSVENNTFVKKKYVLDENNLYKGIINDSGSEANFTTSTGKCLQIFKKAMRMRKKDMVCQPAHLHM